MTIWLKFKVIAMILFIENVTKKNLKIQISKNYNNKIKMI